jgi:hypothetical protein
MPIFIPPLLQWTLGVLGAAVAAKFLVKEWRRVNDELHPVEPLRQPAARENMRALRRDPVSGVYRPE